METYYLLKDDRANRPVILPRIDETDDEWQGIRCPLCAWHPNAASQWCCADSPHSPETGSFGCGAVWNTFLTRGLCPGCAHRWQWTSCLRCAGWSLHEDWYERPSAD